MIRELALDEQVCVRLVDPSHRFYLWCVPPGVLTWGLHVAGRRVLTMRDSIAPQRPFPTEVSTMLPHPHEVSPTSPNDAWCLDPTCLVVSLRIFPHLDLAAAYTLDAYGREEPLCVCPIQAGELDMQSTHRWPDMGDTPISVLECLATFLEERCVSPGMERPHSCN